MCLPQYYNVNFYITNAFRSYHFDPQRKMINKSKFDLSALVLLVPDLEDIIGPYRKKYTNDGAMGMPCHITILYPFMSYIEWNDNIFDLLAEISLLIKPISFRFNGLNYFENKNVLFLEPYPQDEILHVIQHISKAFPMFPPYGGDIPMSELRAHITIAAERSVNKLKQIEKDIMNDSKFINSSSSVVENLTMVIKRKHQ